MHFKIVNPDTLVIENSYISDVSLKDRYGGPFGSYPHIAVPEGLDPDCIVAFKDEDGNIGFSVSMEKTIAKKMEDKKAKIKVAYDLMNQEVYAKMGAIFGTTNSDSAVAYNETFKTMKNYPDSFLDGKFTADRDIGGFKAGDPLDTRGKISNYAEARLAESNAYSVWRLQRIAQFRQERSDILNK